jgi:antitoxin VapB
LAETTTVFKSGNSQAVRLPKEFRFKSKTVEIFRRGNEVVLREKPLTMGEVLDSLPRLTDEDVAALDEMMAIIHEPQPQVERDFAWLDEAPDSDPDPDTTRKSASSGTP